ncbi:MAG: hypothetical protein LBQ44_09865 [Treponema sp.]|jgi:hypothetical protein|nr:hypothetical protein [Treponema sp.]
MSDIVETTVQIRQLEGPFNGTSAQAAEWIRLHDRELRRVASAPSKVISYSGQKPPAGTSGVSLSFYEYSDMPRGRFGTVLELTDTGSGSVVYVVWTNEASGNDAVFYNDPDKKQLDVSFSTRMRHYGMSNDTLELVRRVVKEI